MAAEFTPDSGDGTGLDEAIAAYLSPDMVRRYSATYGSA